jgi:G3E family GTPase
VELDRLLNTDLFDYKDVATSATWIEELEGHHHHHEHEEEHHHHCDDHDCHCHHHHHHDHHEGEAEEYGIGTYVYYRREPMDLGEFDQFVARLWPKNIIRAKGICYFRGEEDFCYLFEQAGKQVKLQNIGQWYATMPAAELEAMKQRDANLRRDWDDRYGDRMQKLVFIGQNLDKKAIAELLDGCLAE